MPSFYKDVQRERKRQKDHIKITLEKGVYQRFTWANYVEYQDEYSINAIFCHEKKTVKGKKKIGDYAWLTNFQDLKKSNVHKIANQAGRLRWKLENEGFNVLINAGYNLEHSYSLDNNTAFNYYYLIQIAHLLHQLMIKSNLFINFKQQMGSIKNFVKRLVEHMRCYLIDPLICDKPYQIRFNTS